jgi:hypothetical protein
MIDFAHLTNTYIAQKRTTKVQFISFYKSNSTSRLYILTSTESISTIHTILTFPLHSLIVSLTHQDNPIPTSILNLHHHQKEAYMKTIHQPHHQKEVYLKTTHQQHHQHRSHLPTQHFPTPPSPLPTLKKFPKQPLKLVSPTLPLSTSYTRSNFLPSPKTSIHPSTHPPGSPTTLAPLPSSGPEKKFKKEKSPNPSDLDPTGRMHPNKAD